MWNCIFLVVSNNYILTCACRCFGKSDTTLWRFVRWVDQPISCGQV